MYGGYLHFIYINLDKDNMSVLLGKLIEQRRHKFARSTPCSLKGRYNLKYNDQLLPHMSLTTSSTLIISSAHTHSNALQRNFYNKSFAMCPQNHRYANSSYQQFLVKFLFANRGHERLVNPLWDKRALLKLDWDWVRWMNPNWD